MTRRYPRPQILIIVALAVLLIIAAGEAVILGVQLYRLRAEVRDACAGPIGQLDLSAWVPLCLEMR